MLLLPYLEQSQPFTICGTRSQAWNSERNRPLAEMMIATFRDPSDTGPPGQTSYLFVTGTGTMFEANQRVNFGNVTDGLSNTMFMVEVKGSGVGWAEPRDFDASVPAPLPQGNHNAGNVVAFGDGSVRSLPAQTPPATLRAAATRGAGDVVFLP